MSNISTNPNNKKINPIISNIPYETLLSRKDTSINVSNGFIISIPQENNKDWVDHASIWMTDDNGYLFNILKPPYNILSDEVKAELKNQLKTELLEEIRNEIKEEIKQEIISELNEEELNNEE